MWNMIHMTTLTNDPYYFRNESRQCSGTRSDLMMFRWLEVNTALKLKSKFFLLLQYIQIFPQKQHWKMKLIFFGTSSNLHRPGLFQ